MFRRYAEQFSNGGEVKKRKRDKKGTSNVFQTFIRVLKFCVLVHNDVQISATEVLRRQPHARLAGALARMGKQGQSGSFDERRFLGQAIALHPLAVQ